jgi:hypothetical protein
MLKNLLIFFFISITLTQLSFALDEDDCSYFKYCGSSSGSSGAKRSSPSVSSSSRSNPGIVAKIKGFGLESLYQKNNPIEFSIVTGNGRIGSMVSSSSGENSFFGNRTPELEDDFLNRTLAGKRYKNNKLQLGTGISLIDKKYFELILGVSAIKNSDTKNLNLGYSASMRLYIINVSAFKYKDDYKFDFTNHLCISCNANYATYYGVNSFSERFDVTAITAGTKFGNFSIDYAQIKSKYSFYPAETSISILSTAYNYNKFLFNFAIRNEISNNPLVENGQLVFEQIKQYNFYGIQYLPNKHLSLGLGYNNYLLNELSFTLTMFL